MNVSLIGGSGFIGTRLMKLLQSKSHSVINIDKTVSHTFSNLTVIADVRSPQNLISAVKENSLIINLAAEHRDDVRPSSLYHDVNVIGAKNICEAAEAKNVAKIVFTSSVAVYGFAPIGTDENGTLNPFNDYGRTKLEAEGIFLKWQAKDPKKRTLVIIRPTVVFGEANRGNVYNLLLQIFKRRFVMIGNGKNIKSMAYVGNVCAFIEHCMQLPEGVHIFNYVDKPDFDMNTLVSTVYRKLGRSARNLRLPYSIGLGAGLLFDLAATLSRRTYPISMIRVRKFCSDSMFSTRISETDFIPPFSLKVALENTIQYEFLEDNSDKDVYFSE